MFTDGLQEPMLKQEENEPLNNEEDETTVIIPNTEGSKTNFRIKFRRNNIAINNDRRKRNKMVRFAEENKNSLQSLEIKSPKRNCAKTVDEQLITDDAVLFLKTQAMESDAEEGQSGDYLCATCTVYFHFLLIHFLIRSANYKKEKISQNTHISHSRTVFYCC